jgi:hypothetical protein
MAMNPLTSTQRKPDAGAHPAQMHANVWKHVNSMGQDDQASMVGELSYTLPILGALASNPKTTRKDVIKAAADAAGAGKIDPSKAVSLISQMPDDPTKLQPWLKTMYATDLTAMVHLKAAAMPQQPQAPQPGVQPQ